MPALISEGNGDARSNGSVLVLFPMLVPVEERGQRRTDRLGEEGSLRRNSMLTKDPRRQRRGWSGWCGQAAWALGAARHKKKSTGIGTEYIPSSPSTPDCQACQLHAVSRSPATPLARVNVVYYIPSCFSKCKVHFFSRRTPCMWSPDPWRCPDFATS